VLLGALVAGGSALAQGTQGGPISPTQTAPLPKQEKKQNPQEAQAADLGRMMIADGEQGFLAQLHDINQTEITLGELTRQKAITPAVRQYGEHMVQDHQKADQQLMDYAKQKGFQLGMAKPTNDVQRRLQGAMDATKAKLPVLQGTLYDQEYLASQVASHDQTLQMVMTAKQLYPQLGSMLDGLLPTLRQHRDQAYQLLGQTQPQVQAAQQPAPQQQPAQQQPPQRQARPPAGERR
jgi:putative membrane protein